MQLEATVLALTPKFPAALSLISSSFLIRQIIWEHRNGRGGVIKRALCSMCLFDLVASSSWFMSTWFVPRGEGSVVFTAGNMATCNYQGFGLQVAIAPPMYNSSLALYYLLSVRYGWSDKELRKIEPFIHVFIFVFAVGTGIGCVPLGLYNPTGPVCWIIGNPPSCGNSAMGSHGTEQCLRGNNAWIYGMALFYIPLWISIAFTTFAMVLISVRVKEVERRSAVYIMSNTSRDTRRRRSTMLKTRAVFTQALLYTTAFYFTWTPSTVWSISHWVGKPMFWLDILAAACEPMQGFLNFIVFLRPRKLLRRKLWRKAKRNVARCCCVPFWMRYWILVKKRSLPTVHSTDIDDHLTTTNKRMDEDVEPSALAVPQSNLASNATSSTNDGDFELLDGNLASTSDDRSSRLLDALESCNKERNTAIKRRSMMEFSLLQSILGVKLRSQEDQSADGVQEASESDDDDVTDALFEREVEKTGSCVACRIWESQQRAGSEEERLNDRKMGKETNDAGSGRVTRLLTVQSSPASLSSLGGDVSACRTFGTKSTDNVAHFDTSKMDFPSMKMQIPTGTKAGYNTLASDEGPNQRLAFDVSKFPQHTTRKDRTSAAFTGYKRRGRVSWKDESVTSADGEYPDLQVEGKALGVSSPPDPALASLDESPSETQHLLACRSFDGNLPSCRIPAVMKRSRSCPPFQSKFIRSRIGEVKVTEGYVCDCNRKDVTKTSPDRMNVRRRSKSDSQLRKSKIKDGEMLCSASERMLTTQFKYSGDRDTLKEGTDEAGEFFSGEDAYSPIFSPKRKRLSMLGVTLTPNDIEDEEEKSVVCGGKGSSSSVLTKRGSIMQRLQSLHSLRLFRFVSHECVIEYGKKTDNSNGHFRGHRKQSSSPSLVRSNSIVCISKEGDAALIGQNVSQSMLGNVQIDPRGEENSESCSKGSDTSVNAHSDENFGISSLSSHFPSVCCGDFTDANCHPSSTTIAEAEKCTGHTKPNCVDSYNDTSSSSLHVPCHEGRSMGQRFDEVDESTAITCQVTFDGETHSSAPLNVTTSGQELKSPPASCNVPSHRTCSCLGGGISSIRSVGKEQETETKHEQTKVKAVKVASSA